MTDPTTEAINTWDDRASTWDDRPETHVYAQQAFATLEPVAAEHLGAWGALRVLDFGAGTGLLTEKLASCCREVVALDVSSAMIHRLNTKIEARGWSNVKAISGRLDNSVRSEPALNRPFDLIVASSVCSFLPDFPAEVIRLRSLLRPGGLFVQWDWYADAAGESSRGFDHDTVRAAYTRADLQLVSTKIGFVFSFEGQEMDVLQGVARR